jgi:hypothetical protein
MYAWKFTFNLWLLGEHFWNATIYLSAMRLNQKKSDKVRKEVLKASQQRTTTSKPPGERHGLHVTCHNPTELACCFFPRNAGIFVHARRFCEWKLILCSRYLAQRRTTASRPRGERHGLHVTWHRPTELACCFSPRNACIFVHARRFCEWTTDTLQ